MKNLLNCHSIGLHSFPISFENGLYRRIFYADTNHNLWKPFEIAVHPHHVDIKITVLDGEIYNPIFLVTDQKNIPVKSFKWNSHILNGNGGFERVGQTNLIMVSNQKYTSGQSVQMAACELHTVNVTKGHLAVWLIEETIPTCEYFPLNYSPYDLTKWNPNALYFEVGNDVRDKYIGKYLNMLP
jgi:hypothetical protein